ncbi:MAG: Lactose transport system permease protein LacF [Anaerolineales bacterium]|nr:Lactose transport system permease protein LacF [Anaerolineales bacterium]
MSDMVVATRPAREGLWQRIWRRRTRNYVIAFLFVLPALINFTIFRYLPILTTLRASLWQYSLLGGYGDFIGLQHYRFMLEDPIFWKSLRVTAAFVLLKVPLQVAFSLVLAVFLRQERWILGVVRSAIFTPVVTSMIVVSVLWSMMYHSQLGLINSLFSIVGIPRQAFLSNANRALPAVTVMMIWKEVGFSLILLLAGLKGIPEVYSEAAIVDGANRLQIFWHVTLPLLRRVLMFVVVTQTIFSSQVFVPVYAMTRGGPLNATKVIVYYIYQYGFLFQDMGYASAMSIATLVILLVVSGIQMRAFRSEVEY